MKKILLPRGYLSWSQMWLWETNPKKYKEKYFFGTDQYVTNEMRFGKKFAEAIQTGKSDDKNILKVVKSNTAYKNKEYKIECVVKSGKEKIPILCFLDSYEDGFVEEDKTGKTPWTQKRANEHGQIGFYDVALRIKTGKAHKFKLKWFETEEREKGNITLTGRVEIFNVEKSTIDYLKMTARIIKVAKQISEAYQEEF